MRAQRRSRACEHYRLIWLLTLKRLQLKKFRLWSFHRKKSHVLENTQSLRLTKFEVLKTVFDICFKRDILQQLQMKIMAIQLKCYHYATASVVPRLMVLDLIATVCCGTRWDPYHSAPSYFVHNWEGPIVAWKISLEIACDYWCMSGLTIAWQVIFPLKHCSTITRYCLSKLDIYTKFHLFFFLT